MKFVTKYKKHTVLMPDGKTLIRFKQVAGHGEYNTENPAEIKVLTTYPGKRNVTPIGAPPVVPVAPVEVEDDIEQPRRGRPRKG